MDGLDFLLGFPGNRQPVILINGGFCPEGGVVILVVVIVEVVVMVVFVGGLIVVLRL